MLPRNLIPRFMRFEVGVYRAARKFVWKEISIDAGCLRRGRQRFTCYLWERQRLPDLCFDSYSSLWMFCQVRFGIVTTLTNTLVAV
jgi:hypothetical protein